MPEERVKNEIKHFSRLSHIWWGAKTPAGQRRYTNRSKIFKKLWQKKKGRILEIGCGDGEFTQRLANLPAKIIACDVTPEVIRRAGRLFPRKKYPNLSFRLDNAENMAFATNSFEAVCGISILHHLDIKKAFQECYRVLQKGGFLFFSEPNLLNPHTWLGLHLPWLRKKMEFSPNETALLRWQVKKILSQIGFKDISVTNYDFLHPLTPDFLMPVVEKAGSILEKLPLVKEVSGSLIIYAAK